MTPGVDAGESCSRKGKERREEKGKGKKREEKHIGRERKGERKERKGQGRGEGVRVVRASARFTAHGYKKVCCTVALGFPMSKRNFRHRLARKLTGIIYSH